MDQVLKRSIFRSFRLAMFKKRTAMMLKNGNVKCANKGICSLQDDGIILLTKNSGENKEQQEEIENEEETKQSLSEQAVELRHKKHLSCSLEPNVIIGVGELKDSTELKTLIHLDCENCKKSIKTVEILNSDEIEALESIETQKCASNVLIQESIDNIVDPKLSVISNEYIDVVNSEKDTSIDNTNIDMSQNNKQDSIKAIDFEIKPVNISNIKKESIDSVKLISRYDYSPSKKNISKMCESIEERELVEPQRKKIKVSDCSYSTNTLEILNSEPEFSHNSFNESSGVLKNVNVSERENNINESFNKIKTNEECTLLKQTLKYIDNKMICNSICSDTSVQMSEIKPNEKLFDHVFQEIIQIKNKVKPIADVLFDCSLSVQTLFDIQQQKYFDLISEQKNQAQIKEHDLEKTLTAVFFNKTIEKYEILKEKLCEIKSAFTNEKLENLGNILNECINKHDTQTYLINKMKEDISAKECEINNILTENTMVKKRCEMLEENIAYLNKQNTALKYMNHHAELAVNIVEADIKNINRTISDYTGQVSLLYHLFNDIENQYNDKQKEYVDAINDITNKLNKLEQDCNAVDINKCRIEFMNTIDFVVNQQNEEKLAANKAMNTLNDKIYELQKEIEVIKDETIRLAEQNQEIRTDFSLKESYANELEKSVDELMKSNKFYEDQLVASDEIIKSLRDTKNAKFFEFSTELAKVKKQYTKENGLLRLKIEELEAKLQDKSSM